MKSLKITIYAAIFLASLLVSFSRVYPCANLKKRRSIKFSGLLFIASSIFIFIMSANGTQAAISSGTVTQANIKMSIVNGNVHIHMAVFPR